MSELRLPKRVALLSVHTSPLDAPGSGDAGGMNVYIRETAQRMAARGVAVDVFTRATNPDVRPIVEAAPNFRVIHVAAGPLGDLAKEDLPAQMVALAVGITEFAEQCGLHYDLVHSHYWLSGQVGWAVARNWHVPLIHTMHTMAKVKNLALAEGDKPEPQTRVLGEEHVVQVAAQLIANTHREAAELIEQYDALPERVRVIHPGVDLDVFTPADGRLAARARLGWEPEDFVIGFVGRLQPLKAPDVLVNALAHMPRQTAGGNPIRLVICGGPSGNGRESLTELQRLAERLGVADLIEFLPPVSSAQLADYYRAFNLVAVPSYSESFGLVAIEAQAVGTPVVAAAVGGLVTAVKDGASGVLIGNHDPLAWAKTLTGLGNQPALRERLSIGALHHAQRFSWDTTTDQLLQAYAQTLAEQTSSDPVGTN